MPPRKPSLLDALLDSSPALRIVLRLAAALLLGAIVLAVYARGLNSPFIFDDQFSVLENGSIARLWPGIAVTVPP